MASAIAGAQTSGGYFNNAFSCGAGGRAPCSVWSGVGCSRVGCTATGASACQCAGRALVGGRASPALRGGAGRFGLVAAGAGRSIATLANGGAREQQTPVCDASGASQGRIVARRARLLLASQQQSDALLLHILKRRGRPLEQPLALPARTARLSVLLATWCGPARPAAGASAVPPEPVADFLQGVRDVVGRIASAA